jgi:polysaccharide biosynthesis protein PslH
VHSAERRQPLPHEDPRPDLVYACFVVPWPLDSGGKQRVYHVIAALTTAYRVHLVVAGEPHEQPALEASGLPALCASVHLVPQADALRISSGSYPIWNPSILVRVRQLLADPLPSLVRGMFGPRYLATLTRLRQQLGDVGFWGDNAPGGELGRAAGFSRIVVDYDDIESEMQGRTVDGMRHGIGSVLFQLDVWKLARYERRLRQRFTSVIVARPEDRDRVGRTSGAIRVVPNGVTPQPRVSGVPDPTTVLFVGSFGWGPNADAVEWFATEVLPLVRRTHAAARFVAVGRRGNAAWADRMVALGVELYQSVPDLVPYYEQATIVVAPVRAGSGTKLKVLEAMMFGRPLVASPIAMEGIDATDGDAVLVAATPEQFADAVRRLFDDPAAGRRLADRARAIFDAQYTWDVIRPQIVAAASDVTRVPATAQTGTG